MNASTCTACNGGAVKSVYTWSYPKWKSGVWTNAVWTPLAWVSQNKWTSTLDLDYLNTFFQAAAGAIGK